MRRTFLLEAVVALEALGLQVQRIAMVSVGMVLQAVLAVSLRSMRAAVVVVTTLRVRPVVAAVVGSMLTGLMLSMGLALVVAVATCREG